ncbi:MAG TPA: peptidylprolyl isomerase [Burkholderiales bacterium]
MKPRTFAALALLAPAALMAQNAAKPAKAPAKETIATVNGVAVPKARLDYMMFQQTNRGMPDNERTRTLVREELVNREVLQQEAQRAGIAKNPEVQTQLDMARQEIMVSAYLRDWVRKHPVSEDEVQKEYEKARAQAGSKEYRARHILVETEEQAKAIIDQLKKGAKFEELAAQHSKDPGSKDRGGDLDWNAPAAFDRAFSDAMVKLDKGQVTATPVHTRFGYHVIRVDDVRDMRFPPLAELKPRIQQQLMQRKLEGLVRELRAKAKVETPGK